jgi:hypothetical protein
MPTNCQCIFDIPTNYIISDVGAKSVVIKTLGNVNMQVIVLVDSTKPLHVTMNCKTMSIAQLPMGLIIIMGD